MFNAHNEAQLTDDDIARIVKAGGAFAPRLPPATKTSDEQTYPAGAAVAHDCGGANESFVQAYRYYADQLRGIQPDGTVQGGKLFLSTASYASG